MKQLKDINILVVGDIMLDKYTLGEVNRISPEAPVPIVNIYDEYYMLGGSGNVARNIKELGPKVTCASYIGNDNNGKRILKMINDLDIESIIIPELKTTILKERIIAGERKIQMLRLDKEQINQINSTYLIEIIESNKYNDTYDMIVVSDYAKGSITKELMNYLNSLEIRIIIDPKPKNEYIYGHPYLITPNEKECMEMGGAKQLINNGCEYILETKGKKGMILHDDKQNWKIDTDEVEVYNVSGAGDTVIAIMSICLSMGWNIIDSSIVANKCASYVVTKSDTSVVPKNKFMEILKSYKKGNI